jgi:hypothetical protein
MSLNLVNLDRRSRAYMVQEIAIDIGLGRLYLSPRLTAVGRSDYPHLLLSAAEVGNDATLAQALQTNGRLKQTEHRHQPAGQLVIAEIPEIAAETLAEGEFNRFYCRAVCRRAIDAGIGLVFVYRAKRVHDPRHVSQRLIGRQIDARQLLEDLRARPGVEPALGVPAGPNSGLSVRLR